MLLYIQEEWLKNFNPIFGNQERRFQVREDFSEAFGPVYAKTSGQREGGEELKRLHREDEWEQGPRK